MQSYAFLVWAYNVVWIGVAAYLLLLFVRQTRTGRRIEKLEQEIGRRAD